MKQTRSSRTIEKSIEEAISDCKSVYSDITPEDIRVGLVTILKDYL